MKSSRSPPLEAVAKHQRDGKRTATTLLSLIDQDLGGRYGLLQRQAIWTDALQPARRFIVGRTLEIRLEASQYLRNGFGMPGCDGHT